MRHEHTLCWDCAKAVGGKCPWASRAEPVEGWRARKTRIKFHQWGTVIYDKSYVVYYCPLFERDALNGGMKKLPLGGGVGHGKNLRRCEHSANASVNRVAESADSRPVGRGNRPVADRQDRGTRILNDVSALRDLGYAIVTEAVENWKRLGYGREEIAMVERGEMVTREEVLEFFFSPWFALLIEPLEYTAEEIRAALNIPEDALWKTAQS